MQSKAKSVSEYLASLAAQKNYLGLYLMNVYGNRELELVSRGVA